MVDHYDGAQSTPEQGGGAMRLLECARHLGLPHGDRRDARRYRHRLVVGMSDPIERIRYDDPDAPKLFDPLADRPTHGTGPRQPDR
ncbi:hypothetical protein GS528_15970 [Rhodococcus hoagii]|nr:hypothetical protein [Prescottella equi]